MLKDVLHGVRVLLRARGWTVVVILSLALGIGASAATFSYPIFQELSAMRPPECDNPVDD